MGSRGDSYDNALAETINGLHKTELIHRIGPWRNLEQVEFETLKWVNWYNEKRIMGSLDYVTPAEYERMYFSEHLKNVEHKPLKQTSLR